MPTLADMQAAVPKCERDGEPLVWSQRSQKWICVVHSVGLAGTDVARRAGYVAMWFSGEAA
jgi:hypothetical protein